MRPHAGCSSPRLRPFGLLPSAERVEPGYRNLFGTPDNPDEFFQGHGIGNDACLDETKRMLEALAYRMCCPFSWPDKLAQDVEQIEDNPSLPSGYTYLAQLVAHDLSFVNSTRPQTSGMTRPERNFRAAALQLDAVYGGGPVERPSAYCVSQGTDGPERRLLRLGYYDDKQNPLRLPDEENARRARDLPRVTCEFRNDSVRGMADVLIADPRNDDQPIIAQMFVLFALLHNAVYAKLGDAFPQPPSPSDDLGMVARGVVRFVYHLIVERDLLERLLHKDIYRRYADRRCPLLDPSEDGRMPVEFSHAACRVGHAMVRPLYRFNDGNDFNLPATLRQNSNFKPKRMPLTTNWIIQWSHFFELGKRPSNLSRRIAPSVTAALFDREQFDGQGLPQRDLLRGSAQMRSVPSLIRHLPNEIVRLSPWLQEPAQWESALDAWLDEPVCNHPYVDDACPITMDDRKILAKDPPLLLYVLLEAAALQRGERLGVLGSVIMAEVLFRALRDDPFEPSPSPVPDGRVHRHGQAEISKLADQVFGGDVPDCMPKLIEFLHAQYQFAKSNVPFV